MTGIQEKIILDMVVADSQQIAPLAWVDVGHPGHEDPRQGEGGDWLSDGGMDFVRSAWASRKLKGFGKFLGISYGGLEDEAARLFARIEEQWSARAQSRGGRRREAGRSKGKRELKNLEWSVSDGRLSGRRCRWSKGLKEDNLVCCSLSDFVSNED